MDSPPIDDGLGQRGRTPGGPQQRPDNPLRHQLSQLHEKFVGITEGAFQRPIKAYLDQVDANEVGTRLKITSKRQTMTKKADQVAEAVEAEGGLESKAVRVMIREEVKREKEPKKTPKKPKKEVKGERGAKQKQQGGASSKKKKSPKSAGSKSNASRSASKEPNKPSRHRKSKKSGGASKTKKAKKNERSKKK